MPIIREYQSQFGAKTADLGRRATPEDFGDASGLANLGAGIYRAGVDVQRIEEQREIADAQVKMAEADMTWDQKRREMQKSATPGVSTATQIQQDMTNYFTQFAGNYKSEATRNYVKLHGTRLTNQNVNQSAAFDVDLAVRDRFEKIDTLFKGYSQKAHANPEGYKRDMEALRLDAENGVGLFDFPGDARTQIAFKKELKDRFENMAFMAAQGDIQNPAVRGMILGQVKTAQSMSSASFDDVFDKLLGAESGKKQLDSNGNPITSPKGAIGIAQVMPSTAPEAAKLAGLPWDEQKYKYDADYNKALGKAYLQAKVAEFDGDMVKGLAAYNAGAGTVRAAMKSNGDNWLDAMPQETQQYVHKIAGGKYGLRQDGTQKGSGWLGELPLAGGGVATEYTMQSEAVKQNGKMIDFPTLVPTLTKEERELMVNDIIPNRKELPESIIQKAIDHANMRIRQGKSVFKEDQQDSQIVEKPPELKQKPAWWDDLSAEQQIKIIREAQTLEKQNNAIADRANAKLINDAENYFSAYGKMPETAPKLGSVTDPEQRRELQTLYEASGKLAGIIDKPAAEQNAFLAQNLPKDSGIPGDFTYQMQVYAKMNRFVQENQKLRQSDQVTAAYKMGFGGKQAEIAPITEYGDGDKLGVDISKRVAHTDAIKQTWGMKDNKVLMENEAENVRNTFRNMPIEKQPAYLAGLAKNITKEHFDALTQQVWKNDHEIRGAAILSQLGIDKSQNGDSAARTSELILLGRKVLDSNVIKEGGEKMPGFKGVLPSDEGVREYVGEHLKGQYLPESTINALTQVVKAHYVGKMQTKGAQKTYELNETANQQALKDSIKTVIGEPSTVGPTNVTRPWGMSDSQFKEEVKNQANDMGYMGRNYGLIALEGRSKQYAMVINGVATARIENGQAVGDFIDLNRPNYKRLQSGGDTIEPRDTGIYADAFKIGPVKEALGISNLKLPKGRADELGWWEQ